MRIPYEEQKGRTSAPKAQGLLTRWAWRIIWSLTSLLPASRKRESLTRWAWGIGCAALGMCFLWYAMQSVVEAVMSTNGGYVSHEDWGEWVGPARYRRHKSGDAFGAMIFGGLCAYTAHALLTEADDRMRKSYFIFMWRDTEARRCRAILGCTPIFYEERYTDAGWERIPRKVARMLAKQPPGCYLYTVGGPDRFCSQRDYLSLVRNQKRQEDVTTATEAQCMVWAATRDGEFGHGT